MIIRHPLLYTAYRCFTGLVYALLAVNIALFFVHETAIEALDSLAWVTLLLLFYHEARELDAGRAPPRLAGLAHAGRAFAWLMILYSAISYSLPGYMGEHGQLDSWNAWTWIGIVLMLEYEVRRPQRYSGAVWRLRNALKFLLYGALFVYAAIWAFSRSWLDCYDALLWILCFFTIEMQLIEFERPGAAGSAGAAPPSRSRPA